MQELNFGVSSAPPTNKLNILSIPVDWNRQDIEKHQD